MADNLKIEVKGFETIAVNFEKSKQEAIKDSAFSALETAKEESNNETSQQKRMTAVLSQEKQSKKVFRFRADGDKIKYFFPNSEAKTTEVTPKMRRFLGAKGVPLRKETRILVQPETDTTDMVVNLPHAEFYRTAFLKRIQKNFRII